MVATQYRFCPNPVCGFTMSRIEEMPSIEEMRVLGKTRNEKNEIKQVCIVINSDLTKKTFDKEQWMFY